MTTTKRTAAPASDPEPHGKRALIYLRVSTKEQATRGGLVEGYSLPAQREACMRRAEVLGVTETQEFIDAGASGRSAQRKDLQRLVQVVNETQVDYLIVYKLDRLMRNRIQDMVISVALEEAGVQLVSCTEHISDTPDGKLNHGMHAVIAQYHSDNLSEEIKTKARKKVEGGGTMGRTPPGYQNVIERVNGREARTVAVDAERVEHVRWAFETCAGGDTSLIRLTEQLEARGMTISASPSLPERPISRSSVQRMLRNPYYIGIVSWQGIQYQGTHEPIISRELFYQVQAVLDARLAGEKQRKFTHYLRGSIYCGNCGSRLCFDHKTNRHGTTYDYFFCVGRHQKRTTCDRPYVSADTIAAQVEDKWRHLSLEPKYAELLETILLQDLEHYREAASHTQRVAKRQIQLLEAQRQKLLQAYYADSMPLDLFKTEQERLTTSLRRYETQAVAADASYLQIERTLKRCLEFAVHCYDTYMGAPPQVRRQLNQAVFEKFFVDEGGVLEARLKEPFQLLLHPQLLEERKDGSETETSEKPDTPTSEEAGELVDINPHHRNQEWTDGVPTWLRTGHLWPHVEHAHSRRLEAAMSRPRQAYRPRLFSFGLGSKEDYLAEGVGFEPTVSCPTHAFQACRFGRSRTPPEGSYRPVPAQIRRWTTAQAIERRSQSKEVARSQHISGDPAAPRRFR